MTTVGFYGEGIRGDAQVSVEHAKSFSVHVCSDVESMYGDAVRAQVQSVADRFGRPNVRLEVRDAGALPFALEARLEAALAAHLRLPLPDLARRKSSLRHSDLRRTRLYVPGNTPKLFPNVGLYRPDGLILDLEDSVPPDAKDAARSMVRQALHHLDWEDAERCVRINSGERGLDDVRATADQGVHTYLVPKAESVEDIAGLDRLLTGLGSESWLLPILESAKGVMRAFEIASASPRVAAVAVGLEDYLADIHAERTAGAEESAWAEGQVVNAARAAGVSPLASVYSKLDDDQGLFAYACRARSRGFDGVGCIHPRQIGIVHRAFAPDRESLLRARAIVDQFDIAIADGVGAIQVDGQMVDAPVYERARRILEMAGP